ncbi:MAG: sulfotransferase [bacterium]
MTEGLSASSGRPILVTGSIRSGTTWVGRMIAESPSVGYIHEPFNPWDSDKKLGICSPRVPYWFFYVTEENAETRQEAISRALQFDYNLIGGLKGIRSWHDVKRVKREYSEFRANRCRGARPLIKDPFALFSAEWFAKTFDMDVVVLIRHPAAVVSSLKRLKWGLPFCHLLEQPALIQDHLHPFKERLREFRDGQRDIIDQGILLWNTLYHVVNQYRKGHREWIFLRHEDISRNPLQRFQALFAGLGLDFSATVRSVVQRHSAACNRSEVPMEWAHSLKRDSRSLIWTWKERLTGSEVERVREGTWKVAKEFYSDEDW